MDNIIYDTYPKTQKICNIREKKSNQQLTGKGTIYATEKQKAVIYDFSSC